MLSLDPDACYAAIQGRDPRFDGVFFTAVATTGIYCRPICPAKTPQRASCQFFPNAATAEAHGYRPCLRCRPEAAPGTQATSFAGAILEYLRQQAVEGLTLEEMEASLGVSLRQARRLLAEEFGLTPLQVLHSQRLLLAKQLLHETDLPVSQIALTSGFRSLRSFNSAFAANYGLAPSATRGSKTKTPHTQDEILLRLAYRPPLAWQALLDYFRSRLLPSVEEIVGLEYRRTVSLHGQSGWLRVSPSQRDSTLQVLVSPSLLPVLGAVLSRLRRLFDLDARPDVIHQHLHQDPLLAPTLDKYPGLRVGGAWDLFELAVRAVLGQQITVKAATTLSGRLVATFGQRITTPYPNLSRLGITPAAIQSASVDLLCQQGLVQARARTLQHLAKFALEGGFHFGPDAHHASVVARLVELPGIGPWTAHYIAMRALRYPDAFPAADLGLRRAVGLGELASTKDTEARSTTWSPWRAYAAAALWKSLP
jgi:AraC family transcriptional regulator, regulatory protein of adaptative response / DNA-3-methyladenine glycosylase II